jgi:hypothetical protein
MTPPTTEEYVVSCAVLDNDKGMMQKYFDRDPSLKSSLPTSRLKSIARWQMSFQYQD